MRGPLEAQAEARKPDAASSPISRFQPKPVQSLPETVQLPRPPGIWTVPGAFVFAGPVFLDRAAGSCLSFTRIRATAAAITPQGIPVAAPQTSSPPGAERLLAWLMAALVVWALFHALGAWTLNHDPRRPLIVIACMAAFLGFWLAMLSARRRRLARAAVGGVSGDRHDGR